MGWMGMNNVRPLKPEYVTADNVIDNVKARIGEIKETFVVNLRHDGKWEAYASGNLNDIFGASQHLQNLAASVMRERSEVSDE